MAVKWYVLNLAIPNHFLTIDCGSRSDGIAVLTPEGYVRPHYNESLPVTSILNKVIHKILFFDSGM